MQACSGAAMMGSLQQRIWTKAPRFPAKECVSNGFIPQAKLYRLKPCRASYVEGSLASSRPSSITTPVSEIGGTMWYHYDG